MSTASSGRRESVRYQPDECPSLPVAAGLGFQYAVLIIARIVVVPVVVVRAAGGSDADLSWILFAAIAICGLTTMMQALRIGRFGSGYVAVMGTSLAVVRRGGHGGGRGRPLPARHPGADRVGGCRWRSPSGSRCSAGS